jgi:hypothetical protein
VKPSKTSLPADDKANPYRDIFYSPITDSYYVTTKSTAHWRRGKTLPPVFWAQSLEDAMCWRDNKREDAKVNG